MPREPETLTANLHYRKRLPESLETGIKKGDNNGQFLAKELKTPYYPTGYSERITETVRGK